VGGAAAGRLVARALADAPTNDALAGSPLAVIAAGKAARPMMAAFRDAPGLLVRHALAIGPRGSADGLSQAEWIEAGHPYPDARSLAAARRALEIATGVEPAGQLVLLLSGGASALLAAPAAGLTLDDKRQTIQRMMHAGADIHAVNTVRRHLSTVKGGRLAAACRGRTLTLAVSDVADDDLSVIGSGPGVPDPTTWTDALDGLMRWCGADEAPRAVVDLLRRGAAGEVADTPKPGDVTMARVSARVIGGRQDALRGGGEAARARGYHVAVMDAPVTGEAREAASQWLTRATRMAADLGRPCCVLSAGETTVRVTGPGKGGRNQEFALALAERLGSSDGLVVAASVGTDGIDGPTDAAGARVDGTTLARARKSGVGDHWRFLDANDAYAFFDPLGDLIKLGPTETNVGDVQVLLVG
jgi:glycerate 2-kinase